MRPGLASLAMLSHVMHLNMLARVPRSVLAGADLSKEKPGGWKSHICALMFQCSQVLHGLQHTENCCLLYMPRKTHFSAISPSPIISPFPFGTEGADPSGSKLCTQGLCYVHPT